eukprot:TRINITY_DN259_c0_g2_i2.p1 TRINITY_DN259_c0_g2~~TRINITY_DN259_c0_g2_i2.p1  ORF type:complete len:119 (-),score=8.85 TRINITY_DN259_c0_g2_i2:1319-1675(-)
MGGTEMAGDTGSIYGWSQVFVAETILLGRFPANVLAFAVDPLTSDARLLKERRREVAFCLGMPKRAADVGCVESCNNSPTETASQLLQEWMHPAYAAHFAFPMQRASALLRTEKQVRL